MTTWSCAYAHPQGGVCGDQTECAISPDYRCRAGHDLAFWSRQALWKCHHPTSAGAICGELAVCADVPAYQCRLRHERAWHLSTAALVPPHKPNSDAVATPQAAARHRLDPERPSYTRRFKLKYVHKDGTSDVMRLYFTAGLYPDGRLGEVFVRADRTGTLASGALDVAATMISLLLQHGVPLADITSKLRHTRFGPGGFTGDAEFPSCSSPIDLLAQWLDRRFGGKP